MDVIAELRRVGHALPLRFQPIPLGFDDLGVVGHLEHRRGVYLNSALQHQLERLIEQEAQAERLARSLSDGRLGAADILPIARAGSDIRDSIRLIKSMRAALTSWAGIEAQITAGKSFSSGYLKVSVGTFANAWFSMLRASGFPGAMASGAIPGPPAIDSDAVGAIPLPMSLGGSEHLYLTDWGNHSTVSSSMCLLIDVLQYAGSIVTSNATTQNVNTTALPRWTGGSGVLMTLEPNGTLGATGQTATLNYIDQDGNAQTTTVTVPGTSVSAGLLPTTQPFLQLAGGNGVRSITTLQIGDMGAGATTAPLNLIMYVPLLMWTSLSTVAANTAMLLQRSTPLAVGSMKKLTSVAGGSKPCLGFFSLTSTTSTGNKLGFMDFVWG